MTRLVALCTLFVACAKEPATSPSPSPSPSPSATAFGGSLAPPSASTATSTSTSTSTARPVRVEAPADAEVASFLRAARARATKEGRVVLVEVGASWCKPCRTLKAAIDAGELDQALENVTLVVFDADAHGPRLDALGYTSKFVPYFAVPRADGSAGELRLDVKIDKNASGADLANALAPLVRSARAR